MRAGSLMILAALGVAVVCLQIGSRSLHAQAQNAAALTGQVTSAEDGPMEGVLVSARRPGANFTVTVATDQQGRYRFPVARLDPGEYTLKIRAANYVLDGPSSTTVATGKPATADLKLTKTTDKSVVAAGLSNLEWLNSFPGTEEQKASVRGCTHCHTLERIARSRYDADGFMTVLARMGTYSGALVPQDAAASSSRPAWRRRGCRPRNGRSAAGRTAAPGGISGDPQPEFDASVEIRAEDAPATHGQGDPGHLH